MGQGQNSHLLSVHSDMVGLRKIQFPFPVSAEKQLALFEDYESG
jgi:hypothetical protein